MTTSPDILQPKGHMLTQVATEGLCNLPGTTVTAEMQGNPDYIAPPASYYVNVSATEKGVNVEVGAYDTDNRSPNLNMVKAGDDTSVDITAPWLVNVKGNIIMSPVGEAFIMPPIETSELLVLNSNTVSPVVVEVSRLAPDRRGVEQLLAAIWKTVQSPENATQEALYQISLEQLEALDQAMLGAKADRLERRHPLAAPAVAWLGRLRNRGVVDTTNLH